MIVVENATQFLVLWIVATAIIVEADANRRRMAKPFPPGDLREGAAKLLVALIVQNMSGRQLKRARGL
jgi:hypothetical protein